MRISILSLSFLLCMNLYAFTVIDNYPVGNSLNAVPDQVIEVYFDDLIDVSTVNAQSVMAFGRWSGPADLSFEIAGFGNVLVITHAEPFIAGEYVMVSFSSSFSSMTGNTLEHGYTIGFWIRTLPGSMDLIDVGHLDVRNPGEGLIQSYGAYAGDLNNDGWGDLAVVNETAEDMRIFISDQGSFGSFNTYVLPLGNKPSANEGADFNGDGEIDMVIGNTQGNMMSIVLGNGDASFGEEVIYTAQQGVRGVTVIDLEGDGDMDVATANRQGNNVSLFFNDGAGNFSEAITLTTPLSAETAILAADMNEDGIMDLVVGGYVSDDLVILLNDGTGNFTLSVQVSTGDAPWMIGMGDVNGDGHVDIASACSGSNEIGIHLGDGFGGLSAASLYSTGSFPLAIDLGDLDGDGDLDVISSNYAGGTYTLYENTGNGTLTDERTLLAEIAGSCAIFHDRNNDQVMDITGIDELADVLIFFENQPTGIEEQEELGFSVYPNPAVDVLEVEFRLAEASLFELFDMSGMKVDEFRMKADQSSAQWTLDKELAKACYIVRRSGSITGLKITVE
jgi:hypothetical protein